MNLVAQGHVSDGVALLCDTDMYVWYGVEGKAGGFNCPTRLVERCKLSRRVK